LCHWLLAARFRQLATGCWLLDSGCWILAAGFWLLAAGCWLLDSAQRFQVKAGFFEIASLRSQ
jgi:hypothetical protein